jgi:hypothetical protein
MPGIKKLVCVICGRKRDEHGKKEWHNHYMKAWRRSKANQPTPPAQEEVQQSLEDIANTERVDNLNIFELSQKQLLTYLENSRLPQTTRNVILKEYFFRTRNKIFSSQDLLTEIESLKKQIDRRNEFINNFGLFIDFGDFDEAQDKKEKEKESEVIEI